MAQTFAQWLKEATGYECQTTFWSDFTIADRFGIAAVKDTYRRAFKEWKTNHIYLTELVIVLNHKAWWHYAAVERGNRTSLPYVQLYSELYEKANNWAKMHLKGEELEYYINITD